MEISSPLRAKRVSPLATNRHLHVADDDVPFYKILNVLRGQEVLNIGKTVRCKMRLMLRQLGQDCKRTWSRVAVVVVWRLQSVFTQVVSQVRCKCPAQTIDGPHFRKWR